MKKWFLAACLPLMIVSCDIFGLGDDGDDDDTMIVDPPMANVSFDYEDKILSGDTLVLTTYVRLVDPEVLFNNMPMEIEVIDNLPADNNAGSASDESAEVPPAVGGTGEAYFIKVRIPESFNGYYDVRIDAVRSDYPSSGILTNVLERGVSVFTMQENGQADFHTGRPVWTDVSDALVLLETVDMLPERSEYSGMKFTTRQTLDSVKCFDAKEEFLPSARLYGFHTISSQYLFAYLTYTSHIDTIYSEMDGYVAYATPEEVTYPVVIVSDNGFILSFEELYREDAFAFNSPYDMQFRCDAADCFYFMPESERGATISDAAIYRVKIDEEMLASIPQPIEEGDYEWIVRQIADVEQVHDGHIGASNSNEFSWQVYGDLVVLSESSLIDGRTSCSILPNSGTPSIDFVGTPSVFVSPQGSLCTLRRTGRGYIQSEMLSGSGGSYRWLTHHQYFDFFDSSNIVVTRTADNVYISGKGRYYYWAPNGEILHEECEVYDEYYMASKSYYPYAETYIYSSASDGLYRARLDSRSDRTLILPSSSGAVYEVRTLGDRALAITTDNDLFLIEENGAGRIDMGYNVFTGNCALVR